MRTVLGRLGLMPLARPLTTEEGHLILVRDHYRCQYCGLDGMSNFENSLVMSVDFVLPRARKGNKNPNNLVAACRACNLIKGQRVFKSLEEAKVYILQRRSELRMEWETRMAGLQNRSAKASK